MAEILMVDGRDHLIAGVGHVLNAAMTLPEAASGLVFLGFGFCDFFWLAFGFVFFGRNG
jgi:hypothetical protein